MHTCSLCLVDRERLFPSTVSTCLCNWVQYSAAVRDLECQTYIYYWHWFWGWQFTFWDSILHIDQKHYSEPPLHKKQKHFIFLLGGKINNHHFINNPLLIEDICKWHITFILLHYWVVWGYSAGFVPTFFVCKVYTCYMSLLTFQALCS